MILHMIFRSRIIQPIKFLIWQIGNKLPQDVLNPAHVSHITVQDSIFVRPMVHPQLPCFDNLRRSHNKNM